MNCDHSGVTYLFLFHLEWVIKNYSELNILFTANLFCKGIGIPWKYKEKLPQLPSDKHENMIYVFNKIYYYKIHKEINGKWMLKFNSNVFGFNIKPW